ncbi:type IV pilin protein [Amantichitinum ursilacus]|uniref:Type II secretion system protein G n=1 Tax=Amantichitinum ursilacus TaxID=857265 RepID=A0A0N1JU34_9NEIS|nr:prepilin-type N-terminal cleavage/methylation domain-containing protein [Amantichitinum ursilacus]KPC55342.1 Type II secretion system protein G precursor [Amantichitinum ursilacus]
MVKQAMRRNTGFTLIELLVVLAIMGMLLSIVAPNYIRHIDQARETALREDLFAVREGIDKFYSDQARYPKTLDELISARYIRGYPVDPVTGRSDSWVLVPAKTQSGGILDIKSGAEGTAADGTRYADW